jgi:hypothetical protein
MLFFLISLWTAVAAPRVIAIGDIHADPEAATATLKMANLIDESGHWSGGNAILIQTGDVTDKGPSSRGVITLFTQLQKEARAAGGDVIAVLGNHEVMNIVGDWRGVREKDLADYDAPATRMADLRPRGVMGQWIHSAHMVVFHEDTVFVHGGVSAQVASIGREQLATIQAKHVGQSAMRALFDSDGPMWYRGYLLADEEAACTEIKQALAQLKARRMVMGHTTQEDGKIKTRCDGAIVGIDTGISAYAGHNFAALELINGDARAIYPGQTIDLPDPKKSVD